MVIFDNLLEKFCVFSVLDWRQLVPTDAIIHGVFTSANGIYPSLL